MGCNRVGPLKTNWVKRPLLELEMMRRSHMACLLLDTERDFDRIRDTI